MARSVLRLLALPSMPAFERVPGQALPLAQLQETALPLVQPQAEWGQPWATPAQLSEQQAAALPSVRQEVSGQLSAGPEEPWEAKEARPSERQAAVLWVELVVQPSAVPAERGARPVAVPSVRLAEERLSAVLPSAALLWAAPWVLASGQAALLAQR